jgi:hypothetical protein
MRVSPAGLQVPLSYLPGIGLGKTDIAVVTPGEAGFFLRRETLGEGQVSRLISFRGYVLTFFECVF